MMELPYLYTEQEAAELLRISSRTLRQIRARRAISHIRLSARMIRYKLSDIEAYIEKHTYLDPPPSVPDTRGKSVRAKGSKKCPASQPRA